MSATTPLVPNIATRLMKAFSVCNCCGVEDGSIVQLVCGWTERDGSHGGASSISMCVRCRAEAARVLWESTRESSP